jgi:hypothetical protein
MPASITPYLVCLGIGVLNVLFAVRVLCQLIEPKPKISEAQVPLLEAEEIDYELESITET